MANFIYDTKYNFKYMFNPRTGLYIRSGILDSNGHDTGEDPFMASFPHLIDVGVMGHCIHGETGLCVKAGVGCYQSGLTVNQPNMSVENFSIIAEQCNGKCNQLAFGGRGDPDQHEHFGELLQISVENNLVPNFTTSGYGMTPQIAELCKKYCGAVAVSWYRSEYTYKAIEMLLNAGVKTNIHYVLGKNSIDEAINRLDSDDFPKGINAVIFLLHKPVGQGTRANVLSYDDYRVKELFGQFDKKHRFKIGMDSCCVPGAINFCKAIPIEVLDTCEAARFSCYIGPDMIMTPCSFDQKNIYGVSLNNKTIEEAWNDCLFNQFRKVMQRSCPDCNLKNACLGGCPIVPEIVLCEKKRESKRL